MLIRSRSYGAPILARASAIVGMAGTHLYSLVISPRVVRSGAAIRMIRHSIAPQLSAFTIGDALALCVGTKAFAWSWRPAQDLFPAAEKLFPVRRSREFRRQAIDKSNFSSPETSTWSAKSWSSLFFSLLAGIPPVLDRFHGTTSPTNLNINMLRDFLQIKVTAKPSAIGRGPR